jgi:hypothetical protein
VLDDSHFARARLRASTLDFQRCLHPTFGGGSPAEVGGMYFPKLSPKSIVALWRPAASITEALKSLVSDGSTAYLRGSRLCGQDPRWGS